MTTRSDDIGVWNFLGIITPNYDVWTKFPTTATGANATLRATYICGDFSKIRSWCWLRPRYQTANTDQVGQAIRLYPSPNKQIIEVPIPQDFQDRSIYYRDFEVRKNSRYIRYIGRNPDIIWQIQLEELWG